MNLFQPIYAHIYMHKHKQADKYRLKNKYSRMPKLMIETAMDEWVF